MRGANAKSEGHGRPCFMHRAKQEYDDAEAGGAGEERKQKSFQRIEVHSQAPKQKRACGPRGRDGEAGAEQETRCKPRV